MRKHTELIAIGEKIRTLRKDRGFTQEAFADCAHLDRSYYGSVERGERNVAVLNLLKIAYALEVQVGDLFPLLNFSKKGKSKR